MSKSITKLWLTVRLIAFMETLRLFIEYRAVNMSEYGFRIQSAYSQELFK